LCSMQFKCSSCCMYRIYVIVAQISYLATLVNASTILKSVTSQRLLINILLRLAVVRIRLSKQWFSKGVRPMIYKDVKLRVLRGES
jgi:hypothetical protein